MYAYAVVYKDRDGFIEYVKSEDSKFLIYPSKGLANKALNDYKSFLKTELKPKKEITINYTWGIFKTKKETMTKLPEIFVVLYTRILKTVYVKRVNVV